MIRGAVFDADGTLLDSMSIWQDAGERYLRARGIQPEPNLAKILYPMTLEEGSLYAKERYALPDSPEDIRAGLLDTVAGFYRFEVQPVPGVPAFLEQLRRRGIPMAVATTGDRGLLLAALDRLELTGFFQAVFTCSELNTSKQEPLIYLTAARALGFPPGEIAVFEDAPHALRTAKAAGFRTAAVEDPSGSVHPGDAAPFADFRMADFRDFPAFWAFASGL